jgi:hypothetical protein
MEIYAGGVEVKSTNVFQAKQLYVVLHDWCIENGYSPPGDSNFPETMYWEARSQVGGSEYWIWWRPTKTIENNKFWRRVINIDFHGVGMKSVEIMYKGKKVKADKGKFEILLQAKLEIDQDKQSEKHWLLKPFLEIFWKRLFRTEIEMYRKEVLGDMKTIQDICRQWFQIGSLTFEKDSFLPYKGYEDEKF